MKRTYENIKKLNRNINLLKRKINKKEKEFLKASGFDVTHREMEYVILIKDNEGSNLQKVLSTLDVSKSTWSNQIKTLVKKKLVTLTQDKTDKRVKRPKLTGKGQDVYDIHKNVRIFLLEKYSSVISDEDLEAIERITNKIKRAVKENNK